MGLTTTVCEAILALSMLLRMPKVYHFAAMSWSSAVYRAVVDAKLLTASEEILTTAAIRLTGASWDAIVPQLFRGFED